MIGYSGSFSTGKSKKNYILCGLRVFVTFSSKFDEALDILMQNDSRSINRHTIQSVGVDYLDYLLSRSMYDAAGRLGIKIFGKNPNLWEDQIYKFASVHQLR